MNWPAFALGFIIGALLLLAIVARLVLRIR